MTTVRDAQQGDADSLGALHVRAWQRAYRGGLMPDEYLDGLSAGQRADLWARALASEVRPRSARLVAEDTQGVVTGFIIVGPAGRDPDAHQGEVLALNVDPEAWGQGIGQALLEAGTARLVEAGFTEAILWVHPDNERARRFYEAAGWRADGAHRNEEILGVQVPEVRYRRDIGGAQPGR
jgi:ribosomal protein S18 acetylase RimI-like enzyme